MNFQKVLVTGGSGFIGSHICERLLKLGYKVMALDNLSTGHYTNIESYASHPNFEFFKADIRDIETCRKAIKDTTYVLHHAALGSVPRSIDDPITSNEVNVSGFLNILTVSKEANVRKVVYAASSSTYGDSKNLPKLEDHIGKPLSPYAVTKYVNELYADVFHKTYGLNTIGLRYFNVFGPKQDPNGAYAAVIPKFTKLLMQKKSPVIYGDGSYSRDFTYIDNVVEANLQAMLTEDSNAMNQVYNIAYGERTNLLDLVDIIKFNLVKFDSNIADIDPFHGDYRSGDVPHSLASIDKAKKLLGYDPKYDVKKGLKAAIDWYWNNLK